MEEKIKVYIDRNRWLRGEGSGVSRLLRSTDGKMCCLGFCMLALGRTEEQIRDVTTPAARERHGFNAPTVPVEAPGLGTSLVEIDSSGGYSIPYNILLAMEVNDDVTIRDGQREVRLHDLLWKSGFDLTFGDGPQEG